MRPGDVPPNHTNVGKIPSPKIPSALTTTTAAAEKAPVVDPAKQLATRQPTKKPAASKKRPSSASSRGEVEPDWNEKYKELLPIALEDSLCLMQTWEERIEVPFYGIGGKSLSKGS